MSNDDLLFPAEVVQMDSPRLAWIKKHQIRRHNATHMGDTRDAMAWCAWLPDNDSLEEETKDPDFPRGIPNDPEACGYGNTEDEAITDLCKMVGIPLWNEEAGA